MEPGALRRYRDENNLRSRKSNPNSDFSAAACRRLEGQHELCHREHDDWIPPAGKGPRAAWLSRRLRVRQRDVQVGFPYLDHRPTEPTVRFTLGSTGTAPSRVPLSSSRLQSSKSTYRRPHLALRLRSISRDALPSYQKRARLVLLGAVHGPGVFLISLARTFGGRSDLIPNP